MSDVAIKVENLSKKYQIGRNMHNTLRSTLSNLLSKKDTEDFWALRDINFEIKKGEAVGIIGRNGAGKSTLLKILSKITKPTTGRIEIDGRLSSLLEVGTGFHPELTGRENIFLNGSLLGMSSSEIKNKFDEIVDFSGVEKFIDTPVKHYSSGMYVRLAFAVSAHLNTEILLVDEVLAVGDSEFQKKCLSKMDEISKIGKTVLFVSHNIQAIRKLTNECIILDHGKNIKTLKSSDLSINYISNIQTVKRSKEIENKTFKIKNLIIKNSELDIINFHERISLSFILIPKVDLEEKSLMIAFENVLGERIFTSLTHKSDIFISLKKDGEISVDFTIPSGINLNPSLYNIVIGVIDPPYFLVDKVNVNSAFRVSEFYKGEKKFEGFLGQITIDPEWEIK